ncbi:MAG: PAS domain S-box protein [Ignavibacteriae bacterium]|nr:PAS domain S-box protein [Ignavibacteriota bacterium]
MSATGEELRSANAEKICNTRSSVAGETVRDGLPQNGSGGAFGFDPGTDRSADVWLDVYNHMPVGVSLTDMQGGLHVNDTFCTMMGYSRQELSGKKWIDITHPDDHAADRLNIDILLAGKQTTLRWEKRYIHKDGHVVWVDLSTTLRYDIHGTPLHFITTIVDISARKTAEAALRESEHNFAALFQNSPVAMAITDIKTGRFVEVNTAFLHDSEYEHDEIIDRTALDLGVYPRSQDRDHLTASILNQGSVHGMELEFRRKHGSTMHALVSSCIIQRSGMPFFLTAIADITEQNRALQALVASELQFRAVEETTPVALYISRQAEEEQRTIYINPAFSRMFGYSMEEIPTLEEWWQHAYPDSTYRTLVATEWGRRMQVTQAAHIPGEPFETTVTCRDGTEKIISWWFVDYGERHYKFGLDLTAQVHARDALSRVEGKYRKLHESMIDGFVYVTMDGKIVECNESYANILGYSMDEVLGKSYPEITPETWHVFEKNLVENQILVRGFSDVYEKEYIRADGTVIPVELHTVLMRDDAGEPVGMWAIVRDISERKRAESRARLHQRRLETLLAILQSDAADTKELLDITLEAALDMLESEIGYIYYYDETRRELTLNSWSGSVMPNCSVANPQTVYSLENTGLWGEAVRQRKPILVNEYEAPNPHKKGYPEGHLPLRRFLTIPVFFEGKIVAVVGMGNKTSDYDHSDILQLTILMDSVWKEIDRRRSVDSLRRHTERLRNLHTLDQRILQALDSPNALIKVALRQLKDLLFCHSIDAGVYSQDTAELQVFSVDCEAGEIGPPAPERLQELHDILTTLEMDAEARGDVRAWPKPDRSELPAEEEQASKILVPLRSAQGLRGVLVLRWTEGSHATTEEVAVAEEVADQITIAIEQSRMLEERSRYAAELELRVRHRTAQLEEANRELESFSYSVSHDLRAPLRHISGFVNLLLESETSALSETGMHYLDTVSDSASRMGTLIDDLLQFSRTGRQEMHESDVDMNEVLSQALDFIRPTDTERRIDWNIAHLPTVRGDRSLLQLVWLNLLGNAIKFTGTREVATIDIRVRESEHEYEFVVADNGVGFDMQYADKLFGVFQRLHTLEEFEGTGIGLANVRRIVFKHGGRTWAYAEPDAGARFYFTIPKQEDRAS